MVPPKGADDLGDNVDGIDQDNGKKETEIGHQRSAVKDPLRDMQKKKERAEQMEAIRRQNRESTLWKKRFGVKN